MVRFISFFLSNLLFGVVVSSCSLYRAPGDNEFCVVPTTNNPAVTLEKQQFLPGARI